MENNNKPRIALTAGDPAGIGPEITLKTVLSSEIREICTPFAIGNADIYRSVAQKLSIDISELSAVTADSLPDLLPDSPLIIDPTTIPAGSIVPGEISEHGGRAAYETFTWTVRKLQEKLFDAVATGPLNKKAMKLAGVAEPGHTEILARLCGSSEYAMLYWSRDIAVSLATIHHALKDIPSILTEELVYRTALLTHQTLRALGNTTPVIAILGLNPHSGEQGHFGKEESEVIEPAICRLIEEGIDARGPVPADTAFTEAALQVYDGVVAMYHDQGSIPFKMLHFNDGVNHSMGLPVIRTSVDHGTAFDLAWKGTASTGSMEAAVQMAVLLCKSRV